MEKKKIDNEFETRISWFKVRDRFLAAKQTKEDRDHDYRVAIFECLACFYAGGKFAGSAFTDYTCGLCGKINSYHNTRTPKYCQECCKENNFCRECGADMTELKDMQMENLF